MEAKTPSGQKGVRFSVKFTEAPDGMEIEMIDDSTMCKSTIKDAGEDNRSLNMFWIGGWIIKTLKPRFREIAGESIESLNGNKKGKKCK